MPMSIRFVFHNLFINFIQASIWMSTTVNENDRCLVTFICNYTVFSCNSEHIHPTTAAITAWVINFAYSLLQVYLIGIFKMIAMVYATVFQTVVMKHKHKRKLYSWTGFCRWCDGCLDVLWLPMAKQIWSWALYILLALTQNSSHF